MASHEKRDLDIKEDEINIYSHNTPLAGQEEALSITETKSNEPISETIVSITEDTTQIIKNITLDIKIHATLEVNDIVLDVTNNEVVQIKKSYSEDVTNEIMKHEDKTAESNSQVADNEDDHQMNNENYYDEEKRNSRDCTQLQDLYDIRECLHCGKFGSHNCDMSLRKKENEESHELMVLRIAPNANFTLNERAFPRQCTKCGRRNHYTSDCRGPKKRKYDDAAAVERRLSRN